VPILSADGKVKMTADGKAVDPRFYMDPMVAIPVGGSVGAGGVILAANGQPVLGANGQPLPCLAGVDHQGKITGGPMLAGDARERMAQQPPGTTQAYLLESPTYVKFHTTPLPPPEPAAKKGKKGKGKGGKKGKKEKVVPPPAFQMGLDEALIRLDPSGSGKGGPKIDECLGNIAKKYEEEKKLAEKLAAEKAKAKAQAEKDAKAKEAKGKKK